MKNLICLMLIAANAFSQQFSVETSAKDFVELLNKKDFQAAQGYFDDTMKKVVPQEKLKETWEGLITEYGAFKQQSLSGKEQKADYVVIIIKCEFEKQALNFTLGFNKSNRIGGLHFAPAVDFLTPAYADKNAFTETDVKVGTGEAALSGTLSLPVSKTPVPVVILVHGSGPNDRDETIGSNKPFRDLAWGLASRGIAVLRYEKRTKEHPELLAGEFTVKEETADDAVLAIELMRKTTAINANKIFVLGHSLGGMLLPQIGRRDTKIAGLISLAGNTRPLEDVIIEQYNYLFALDGTISKAEQTALDDTKVNVAKIKELKPTDIGTKVLYFGFPAKYWLDLRGYDPPKTAAKLKQPMLILQGERDYQVTMENFGRWKTTLSTKPNVQFKSYQTLNHLFLQGTGKGNPDEYKFPGNVAEQVIADIANWVKK